MVLCPGIDSITLHPETTSFPREYNAHDQPKTSQEDENGYFLSRKVERRH